MMLNIHEVYTTVSILLWAFLGYRVVWDLALRFMART